MECTDTEASMPSQLCAPGNRSEPCPPQWNDGCFSWNSWHFCKSTKPGPCVCKETQGREWMELSCVLLCSFFLRQPTLPFLLAALLICEKECNLSLAGYIIFSNAAYGLLWVILFWHSKTHSWEQMVSAPFFFFFLSFLFQRGKKKTSALNNNSWLSWLGNKCFLESILRGSTNIPLKKHNFSS